MDEFDIFEGVPMEDTTPTEVAEEPTAEPKAEPTEEPTAEPEKKEEAAPQAATISFKHHEKTADLDRASVESLANTLGVDADALVATLQKGYDYDRKNTRLSEIESKLDKYGKSLNVDRDGLFGILENAGDRAAMRNISAQIKAEHPNWGDDAVQELSRARLAEQKRVNAENIAAQEKAREEETTRPLVEFFLRHSDITPDTMSDEMKKDIFERGLTPEEAYQKHLNTEKDKEIESIKAELAKLQKDAENRAKSIGSVTSEVASNPVDDVLNDILFAFK